MMAQLDDVDLTLEVQISGRRHRRTIAMGLPKACGPVSPSTHGKVFPCRWARDARPHHDVLGKPQDEKGPVQATEYLPFTVRSGYDEQAGGKIFWSRDQGDRFAGPFAKGGKVGLFRRRRRGQDREHARAHQQHRQQYTVCRCLPGRRANPQGNDFYHEMIESGVITRKVWQLQWHGVRS